MEQHFTKKDIIILLTCLFLIVTTGFFEYFNYGKAFPEQAITFHVNRKKSRQIAEQFLQRMNVPFSDYQHAVTFDYDDNAKTFLEKEVGIEESKDLLSDDFKVWKWANRWFKPLYKEELKVGVSLDGKNFLHIFLKNTKLIYDR